MPSLAVALAETLQSLGVSVVTYVPGFGASQTFEAYRSLSDLQTTSTISFHEEAAFGIAHGAALTGGRAACLVKAHGFTKAMNAITDALSAGCTAGFVTVIFEDKDGSHSDNILDIIPVIRATGIPHFVSARETVLEDLCNAYKLSEELSIPTVVVVDAEWMGNNVSSSQPRLQLLKPPPYVRNIKQHLVCPFFAKYQYEVFQQKIHGKDWRAIPEPADVLLPDSLPVPYQQAVTPYLPIFKLFQTMEYDIVTGDAGVSTLSALPPYEIVNFGTYMGGSLPLAIGAALTGYKRCWSFIGDFSFLAAGHFALMEALLRNIPLKVLIYANGRAQTTGGQPLDLRLLDRVLEGYKEFVRLIDDPQDVAEVTRILGEANASNQLEIIVANFA